MKRHVEYQGKKVPIKDSQSVLDALEMAGFIMNFQCRNGICGACRCKVLSGEVSYKELPFAMTKEDEILICIAQVNAYVKLANG